MLSRFPSQGVVGIAARINRRTILKASTAVSAMGLTGLGLASTTRNSAENSAVPAGLKPLFINRNQTQSVSASIVSSQSPPPNASIRCLRRLTFGYSPNDLTDFEALGSDLDERLQHYVNNQLDGFQAVCPPNNDPQLSAAISQAGSSFETLQDSLQTLWQERVVAEPDWPEYQYPLVETRFLTLLRAVYSDWQLAEVLADFWHTHFSVEGDKFEVSPVFVHYDRDVIRPNMLGNFRQMLEAVTKSTAMMRYLDNASNSKYGPNENFARELQELHTLGAVNSFGFTPEAEIPAATALPGSSTVLPAGLKAGYSELDVRQATLCLTGWTISNQWSDGLNTGEFIYLSDWHDSSSKRVYGIDLTNNGQGETEQILDLLALHPNTARYVCRKLCRRLIADEPPESIVEKAAAVFNDQWQAADQLKQVVKTIILSDEFKAAGTWGAKTKKPFELMAGSARSCGGFANGLVRPDMSDWQANMQLGESNLFSLDMYWMLNDTGNMPFGWSTPDGFPDSKPAWLGSTPLVMTWRLLNSMFMNWYPDDPNNTSADWHVFFPLDVVAASKAALPLNQHTARDLVDHWVKQFLGYDFNAPGTEQLNAGVRDRLIAFMQQDAAAPDTVLDLDANVWDNQPWMAYVPHRLQTLVASIGMLPDNLLR